MVQRLVASPRLDEQQREDLQRIDVPRLQAALEAHRRERGVEASLAGVLQGSFERRIHADIIVAGNGFACKGVS
jgi:hypothetical protein